MATRNEEVMEMVRRELEQRPDAPLTELYERAQVIDPTISELSTRQFHAKYPLQVKRGRGPGSQTGARKRTRSRKATSQRRTGQQEGTEQQTAERKPRQRRQETEAQNRDAIRGVFLQFASDFAQAESRPEIVGVLSNVDTYVDQVVKLAGRS